MLTCFTCNATFLYRSKNLSVKQLMLVAFMSLAFFMTGCKSSHPDVIDADDFKENQYYLIGVQDEDGTGTAIGKVAGRVGLDIITVGIYEINFAVCRNHVKQKQFDVCQLETKEALNSLKGCGTPKILKVLGAPDETISDGEFGQVFIWNNFSLTGEDFKQKNFTKNFTIDPDYLKTGNLRFYLGPKGKMYCWRIIDTD